MRALYLAVICACSGSVGDATDSPADGQRGDGPAAPGDGRTVPGGEGEPAALAGITLAHNQVRNMVDTPTPLPFLTWSDALAATAAAWAAQCVDTEIPAGLIDHNAGRSAGHPYYVGENIFGSGGTATGDQAVASWASEGADYNYATNTCSGLTCGHYTQLVWRDTREVGCALHDCPNLSFGSTVVCDYGPGGNVGNQRPY